MIFTILLLKKDFRICWRKSFFCIVLYPLKSAKAQRKESRKAARPGKQ